MSPTPYYIEKSILIWGHGPRALRKSALPHGAYIAFLGRVDPVMGTREDFLESLGGTWAHLASTYRSGTSFRGVLGATIEHFLMNLSKHM